jgi:hypothetical protein
VKLFLILCGLVLVVYWLGLTVIALLAGVLLGVGIAVLLLIRFALNATDYME